MSLYGLDKRAEELKKKRKRDGDDFRVPHQPSRKRHKKQIRKRLEEDRPPRSNRDSGRDRYDRRDESEEIIRRRTQKTPHNRPPFRPPRSNSYEISSRSSGRYGGGRKRRSDWEEESNPDPFLFPDKSKDKYIGKSPLTVHTHRSSVNTSGSRSSRSHRRMEGPSPFSRGRPSREPTPSLYDHERRMERIQGPIYYNDRDVDEVDYSWYGGELGEEGMVMDLTKQDHFLGNEEKFRAKEQRIRKNNHHHKEHIPIKKKVTNFRQGPPKHTQFMKDHLRWERNRMRSSGLSKEDRKNATSSGDDQLDEDELDDDNQEEEQEFVIVHEITPPFLDGRVKFTEQDNPVAPVVDLACDFAVAARKGSEVVRQNRLRRDREKAIRNRFRFRGTRMGRMMEATDDDNLPLMSHENRREETRESAREETKFLKVVENQKWGGSSSFSRKLSLSTQRKKLPIYRSRNELMNMIRENNVVIIVGETGSGKTTQLTQFCYEAGYKRIGCTQPRRVAAVSVAKRVSEEMGCHLGDLVGYSIRFEDCTSDRTIIKYMTDGVLLRETLKQPSLDRYDVIIMDEAHERSLNTDILFGILKRVVGRRRDMKLIVTSATMDSTKFSNFFGGVPIYNIPGRTFPVRTHFTRNPVTDYVDAAVKQALSIHFSTPLSGDMLIFMTGQEDIITTCELLEERIKHQEESNDLSEFNEEEEGEEDFAKNNRGKLLILPIYSLLPSELQAKIFVRAPPGFRKCIVATNIAETSLTVDGIFYVIDCGFCKLKCYNPKVGMDVLQRYPESRAGAKQREGRAGRTGPGFCYRLFTEKQYNREMLEVTVPEIQRTNLSNVILLLKSLGINQLLDFDFMDPPPQDNMKKSMFQLYILGALDSTGNLTKLGAKMIEFPLDPILSKMILEGVRTGCTNEIITIVSMLSVPNLFYRPASQEDESDSRREKFYVPESDHLTMLNIYQQWKLKRYSSTWCRANFIHYKGMRKVREIRHQLCEILQKNNLPLITCGGISGASSNEEVIRKTICSGYLHHVAKLEGIGEYVNVLTGLPCSLHPSSSLFGIGYTPQFVVYHELVLTSKEYMKTVSSIRGGWLEELCPMFYSVKRSHRTHEIRKKEQKGWKKEMEEKMEEKIQQDSIDRSKEDQDLLSVMLRNRKRCNQNDNDIDNSLRVRRPPLSSSSSSSSSSVRSTPRRFGL